MGQYKVPQNVEAEDHILGPLTFKQFIYAFMGIGYPLICFAFLQKVIIVLLIVAPPPTILLLLLAFYTRDGQNFEQILIAMVTFFSASRSRLWVKEEVIETFHVEPPKQPVVEVTQRNPEEVRSELQKVGNLIDSRGWNYEEEDGLTAAATQTATKREDRLVAAPVAQRPQEQKVDMLDKNNPLASNLNELLQKAAEDVRKEAVDQMNTKEKQSAKVDVSKSESGVTSENTNGIVKLAMQGEDLTVAQLAAQATRMAPAQVMQSAPTTSG